MQFPVDILPKGLGKKVKRKEKEKRKKKSGGNEEDKTQQNKLPYSP
jgi:hypothetical protein